MAKKRTFKTIIEQKMRRGSLPSDVLESRDWYRQKAIRMNSLRGASSERIMRIGRENQRMKPTLKGRMMLGKMFMFQSGALLGKIII